MRLGHKLLVAPRRPGARLPTGRLPKPDRGIDGKEHECVGGGNNAGARAERFVVCHNPDAADRDEAVRERLIMRSPRAPSSC